MPEIILDGIERFYMESLGTAKTKAEIILDGIERSHLPPI